jgi:RimJ/RimL family protein N-acetyltransferase
VFSDDIPKTPDGFLAYVGLLGSLWFEVICLPTEENVGFLYLSDMLRSFTDKRYLTASFHAIVWDAKAGKRLSVARAFIRQVFRVFRLHRLQAVIPLTRGGAIRITKKLGFKEEGTLREARRYNGVWFGVLLLSLLESEVG